MDVVFLCYVDCVESTHVVYYPTYASWGVLCLSEVVSYGTWIHVLNMGGGGGGQYLQM